MFLRYKTAKALTHLLDLGMLIFLMLIYWNGCKPRLSGCSSSCTTHIQDFTVGVCRLVLLLLVSGYIGLRMLALQEQLNSLGALTDWSSHHRE